MQVSKRWLAIHNRDKALALKHGQVMPLSRGNMGFKIKPSLEVKRRPEAAIEAQLVIDELGHLGLWLEGTRVLWVHRDTGNIMTTRYTEIVDDPSGSYLRLRPFLA